MISQPLNNYKILLCNQNFFCKNYLCIYFAYCTFYENIKLRCVLTDRCTSNLLKVIGMKLCSNRTYFYNAFDIPLISCYEVGGDIQSESNYHSQYITVITI